eukprot:4647902-Pyramimonas_sp.AAC.1
MQSETFKVFAEDFGESLRAREAPKPAAATSPFSTQPGDDRAPSRPPAEPDDSSGSGDPGAAN